MRKRDMQSIELKLGDLREYEAARRAVLQSREDQETKTVTPYVKIGLRKKQQLQAQLDANK